VRRPPEDLTAAGAAGEAALHPVDERRDFGAHGGSRDRKRASIALDAATEKAIFTNAEAPLLEHLADLVAQVLAFDQDVVLRVPPLHEPPVARQDRAALPAGHLNQLVVLDAGEVGDVMAQQDEPLGEGPEHAVGGEFHRGDLGL